MKRCVYDLCPAGRENAVSLRQLANALGVTDRTCRKMIARERQTGALILSSTEGTGGYYRPGNKEELRRFVASMDSRSREIIKAATVAREALNRGEGVEG